jgi:hypothetical protein
MLAKEVIKCSTCSLHNHKLVHCQALRQIKGKRLACTSVAKQVSPIGLCEWILTVLRTERIIILHICRLAASKRFKKAATTI